MLLIRVFDISNYFLIANFVDIDHFSSKNFYVKNRDSFTTHFFHKYCVAVTAFAFLIHMHLGLGLILHFMMDKLKPRFFIK